MLETAKGLLSSKTFWSNMVGLVAFLLRLVGFGEIAAPEQAKLVDVFLQIATGVSFILSTVFRVVATQKVTLVSPPPSPPNSNGGGV